MTLTELQLEEGKKRFLVLFTQITIINSEQNRKSNYWKGLDSSQEQAETREDSPLERRKSHRVKAIFIQCSRRCSPTYSNTAFLAEVSEGRALDLQGGWKLKDKFLEKGKPQI